MKIHIDWENVWADYDEWAKDKPYTLKEVREKLQVLVIKYLTCNPSDTNKKGEK